MQKTWQLFKDFGLEAIPILKVRESLLQDSQLTQNYLVLVISSCLIATLGLLINSTAVIIGAMIIAPLMLPLRGFSFATLEGDWKLLRQSFISMAVGTILAIACSGLVGLIIGLPEFGSEVLSRTQPTLIDLLIAIAAGGVSGYAKIRPSIGDAIPGTAIAVALMPPLCVVGLSLSQGDWLLARGALLLYLTNLIGINLACLVVYVLSGYALSSELTRSLSWGVSATLIIMLAVPLGISFWQVLSDARAKESLRQILSHNSIIQRPDVEILKSNVDWRTEPPSLKLVVRADKKITSEEVGMVEQILTKKLHRSYQVVFYVTPSQTVWSSQAK
ncbi:MAG: TIGR00341 family protein [Calothrix sp. MO_167.B12]|nr:TIGR00341 family protein [Calothrix sp. MO_167.B12]